MRTFVKNSSNEKTMLAADGMVPGAMHWIAPSFWLQVHKVLGLAGWDAIHQL